MGKIGLLQLRNSALSKVAAFLVQLFLCLGDHVLGNLELAPHPAERTVEYLALAYQPALHIFDELALSCLEVPACLAYHLRRREDLVHDLNPQGVFVLQTKILQQFSHSVLDNLCKFELNFPTVFDVENEILLAGHLRSRPLSTLFCHLYARNLPL